MLTDRESCQRLEGDAKAIEARDMENDVDPDYGEKIRNIENVSDWEKNMYVQNIVNVGTFSETYDRKEAERRNE